MCLKVYVNYGKSLARCKVAEGEIRVYKVLERREGDGCWRSPYQRMPYPYPLYGMMEDYGSFQETVPLTETSRMGTRRVSVSFGFHTFVYREDAIRECRNMRYEHGWSTGHPEFRVVECAIPKGARYFEGTDNGIGCWCYASETLWVTEREVTE